MGLDKVCYNIKWKEMRFAKNGAKIGVFAHIKSAILVHNSESGGIILIIGRLFKENSKCRSKNFKETISVKRLSILLLLLSVVAVSVSIAAVAGIAETGAKGGEAIPDDTPVTYGYLQKFKEELRQEIIDELTANGGINISTTYEDISFNEGDVIILSPDAEVIYRGGGAVAITSSNEIGEGITDMSSEKELFSGESLEYGHIYHASSGESRRAILITGGKAYFTIRGGYEIG